MCHRCEEDYYTKYREFYVDSFTIFKHKVCEIIDELIVKLGNESNLSMIEFYSNTI